MCKEQESSSGRENVTDRADTEIPSKQVGIIGSKVIFVGIAVNREEVSFITDGENLGIGMKHIIDMLRRWRHRPYYSEDGFPFRIHPGSPTNPVVICIRCFPLLSYVRQYVVKDLSFLPHRALRRDAEDKRFVLKEQRHAHALRATTI
jgi:hypothetical protein